MEEQNISLLIVDDEENTLTHMEKYIRKRMTCFSEIYTARNGQEALDVIYRVHPAVMLLDVQMPGKNGLDVMEEAMSNGVCPKTVILSGYDTFSYAQQAVRLGAVDYLLKPCRSTEICQRLEEALEVYRNGRRMRMAEEDEEQSANPIVRSAQKYIGQHLTDNINLSEVAEKAGVSGAYLSTLFSQQLGCGFIDYLNRRRIEYAVQYMKDGTMKIYEVAYRAGFRDEKYFSRVFKKVMGQSPSEYRKSIGVKEN